MHSKNRGCSLNCPSEIPIFEPDVGRRNPWQRITSNLIPSLKWLVYLPTNPSSSTLLSSYRNLVINPSMMHWAKYQPETPASPPTSFTLGPARDDLRACGLLRYCALIFHHLRGHFCIENQSVHPASPRYVLLLLTGYRNLGAKLSPNQSTKNQF